MNHIDELLGVATFAAAGMFAAVAIAPVTSVAATAASRGQAQVVSADPLSVAPVVVLPPVDIVARRSVETARVERVEQLERHPLWKAATRPGA